RRITRCTSPTRSASRRRPARRSPGSASSMIAAARIHNGRMSEAPEIAGWKHVYSGKVRDLYAPTRGSDDRLLVVASDRVSAFDHVLEPGIPGKGALLTSLSGWWFAQLAGGDGGEAIPNHLTGEEPPEAVADRAMVVR